MNELDSIKDLISEKSYNEAKNELESYISNGHENDLEAVKLMGLVNVNLEKFEEAKSYFEKAHKLAPTDATTLFYLANCHDNLENLIDAEKLYKKLLEIREEYIDAYKNLCIIYLKTNRELNAIELATKAKSLAPNDYTFDYLIGTASISLKQYNQGIKHLEAALAMNPSHFQIYNNLGTAYLLVGQREKAIECYKKAVKIKPDDAISFYNIGSIFQIQNKHAQACEYFEKAYQLENKENYLISLALSELKAGMISDAAKHYKALALLHPEKDSFQYNLASCYEALKNYDQAIVIMKNLLARNPKSITMAQKLANLYIETRQFYQLNCLIQELLKKSLKKLLRWILKMQQHTRIWVLYI